MFMGERWPEAVTGFWMRPFWTPVTPLDRMRRRDCSEGVRLRSLQETQAFLNCRTHCGEQQAQGQLGEDVVDEQQCWTEGQAA